MAKDLKTFLDELLPAYDVESCTFDPSVQEEFITSEGWLDKFYICKLLKLHISTNTFRDAVKKTFGTVKFEIRPVTSEMTKDEFLKYYEFGKFNQSRSWVSYIYKLTGKVVTHAVVNDGIINSVEPNNGIRFWSGGVRKVRQETRQHFETKLFS